MSGVAMGPDQFIMELSPTGAVILRRRIPSCHPITSPVDLLAVLCLLFCGFLLAIFMVKTTPLAGSLARDARSCRRYITILMISYSQRSDQQTDRYPTGVVNGRVSNKMATMHAMYRLVVIFC
jgi:hypothetical protein